MKITINKSKVDKLFKKLEVLPEEVMQSAHEFFVAKTPKREGNARRNTTYKKLKIDARYPYAGRLDEGWSKQAPRGMTEPTLNELDKFIQSYIGRIS